MGDVVQLHSLFTELGALVSPTNDRGSLIGYSIVDGLFRLPAGNDLRAREMSAVYASLASAVSACQNDYKPVLLGLRQRVDPIERQFPSLRIESILLGTFLIDARLRRGLMPHFLMLKGSALYREVTALPPAIGNPFDRDYILLQRLFASSGGRT